MAAVAAPVMGPVSDVIVGTLGDSILVEIGVHTGFELTTKLANDLVIDKTVKHMIPIHSKRLETTGIKELLITLKYKHTIEDAALGFYRGSLHKYVSLCIGCDIELISFPRPSKGIARSSQTLWAIWP